MFICDKNFNCCNYQYADNYKDLEESAKNCGHLIEVAPVIHAHWITRNWGESTMDLREICEETVCSNCGTEGGDFMKYCPNCGAKMDEEI